MGALNYPNFKNEVAKTDPERCHVYASVWEVLRGLRGLGGKPEEHRKARNGHSMSVYKHYLPHGSLEQPLSPASG